jgi:diaminopropionate ammonia-lyase
LPHAAPAAKLPGMHQLFINPRHGTPGLIILPEGGYRRARAEITAWPGYAPTPLRRLQRPGIGALFYKDESGRFGLGSFKALGGAHAVARLLAMELARRGVAHNANAAALESGRYAEATRAITVTCATDGNHGRSVAWGAQRFGARCVIFVHRQVSQGRRDAIGPLRRGGAGGGRQLRRQRARGAAHGGCRELARHQRHLLSRLHRAAARRDAGLPPDGEEALTQMGGAADPRLRARRRRRRGGGGRGAAAQPVRALGPRLVVAEPDRAACLLASARAGEPVA